MANRTIYFQVQSPAMNFGSEVLPLAALQCLPPPPPPRLMFQAAHGVSACPRVFGFEALSCTVLIKKLPIPPPPPPRLGHWLWFPRLMLLKWHFFRSAPLCCSFIRCSARISPPPPPPHWSWPMFQLSSVTSACPRVLQLYRCRSNVIWRLGRRRV